MLKPADNNLKITERDDSLKSESLHRTRADGAEALNMELYLLKCLDWMYITCIHLKEILPNTRQT